GGLGGHFQRRSCGVEASPAAGLLEKPGPESPPRTIRRTLAWRGFIPSRITSNTLSVFIGPQVKMSKAANPSSTQVCTEICDSASKRKPVTPLGLNWWKYSCSTVAPPASAALHISSLIGSTV